MALAMVGIVNGQYGSRSGSAVDRFSLLMTDDQLTDRSYITGHLNTRTLPHIPSNYSYNALGLFCKLDVKFEKHLKFPVLFRLGDARSVIEWEGKGSLRKR